MARYRGPIGKVSRRLGFGITEKGERLLSKRPYPPGMHGHTPNRKMSDYGIRQQEKQKARYVYGMLEKQFRSTFERARRSGGETGAEFFILLERRLDNTVYRLGWATTRAQARQLVTHGHITVNGRKTDIASYTVSEGDVLSVREQSRKRAYFVQLGENPPSTAVAPWLRRDGFNGEVIGTPRREDAEADINEQLIVEFYSR
jgi:small subunit ribosomal protein S4